MLRRTLEHVRQMLLTEIEALEKPNENRYYGDELVCKKVLLDLVEKEQERCKPFDKPLTVKKEAF